MDKRKQNGSCSSWTDEKHTRFLNSVEASFVRSMMFEGNTAGDHPLRLDRYMPDSSESTQDLKSGQTQRKKKLHKTGRTNGGSDKRPRRLSSQPSDSSLDQGGSTSYNEQGGRLQGLTDTTSVY